MSKQKQKKVFSSLGKDLAILPDNDVETALCNKWKEIPGIRLGRIFSSDCLAFNDKELLEFWEGCREETTIPEVRGWFQGVYQYQVSGKRLLDIGSGLGIDGIFFAEQGAHVTFSDIISENLELVRRICRLKQIKADFYLIDKFDRFDFDKEFDLIMAIGSLHHAPFDFVQREVAALLPHLIVGGRFMMLSYPKERFDQYQKDFGVMDQADFGKITDGEQTPWAEWYDADKICSLFGPTCHLNWCRNFGKSQNDFNWFELTKLREQEQK